MEVGYQGHCWGSDMRSLLGWQWQIRMACTEIPLENFRLERGLVLLHSGTGASLYSYRGMSLD